MRLDKYLSEALSISRNDSIDIIKNKRVFVNGCLVVKNATKLEIDDEVTLDGEKITLLGDQFIMMNKPSGFVCSKSENDGKSIYSLFPNDLLNPIGRLDKDTTGLLLLTTRGDVIHKITSPKNNIEKEYLVETKEEVNNIEKLLIDEHYSNGKRGSYVTHAKSVKKISEHCFSIVILDGKYHEIKEMVYKIGLTLTSLKRIRIGSIKLDSELEEGNYRNLNDEEIKSLLE